MCLFLILICYCFFLVFHTLTDICARPDRQYVDTFFVSKLGHLGFPEWKSLLSLCTADVSMAASGVGPQITLCEGTENFNKCVAVNIYGVTSLCKVLY